MECKHYNTSLDVVSIQFFCCGDFFPCYKCHLEMTDHPAEPWPVSEFKEKAVLCRVCESAMTIDQYLACEFCCPFCKAKFNPGCRNHWDLYFAMGTPSFRFVSLQ